MAKNNRSTSPKFKANGPQPKPTHRGTVSPRNPAPESAHVGRLRKSLKPVAVKSIARAKLAFKNFTLSKFGNKLAPRNYLIAGRSVAGVQKELIKRSMENLKSQEDPNP